jgi:hypothetical protein
MRCFILFLLIATLLIIGNTNTVYSQAEEKPILLLVQSERTIPSKVFEYEDAQKNANEFIKKYLPSVQWDTYSSENDTYYYITQIQSLDDITKMFQEGSDLSGKAGDEFQEMLESFRDKIFFNSQEVYVYDKKGSYIPKEPGIKPEDVGFERWTVYEYYPYCDQAALNASIKEIKEFFEKNNILGGYNVYNKYFGGNSYESVLSERYKNRGEFFTYWNEWNKKYWDEFKPLYIKFMSFVKDYKIIDVWPRKDLSIIKEKSK